MPCKSEKSEIHKIYLKKYITISYLPFAFPYWTAFSNKCRYCGILDAAKSSDGLVVASVGLYWEIAKTQKHTQLSYVKQAAHSWTNRLSVLLSKSPESATTVVNFFSCSNVEAMFTASCKEREIILKSFEVTRMNRSAGSTMSTSSTFDQRFLSRGNKQNGGRSAVDKRCGNRRWKGMILVSRKWFGTLPRDKVTN